MTHLERTLVLCRACGSMRCIELVDRCFCGADAYRPAPPPRSPDDKLFEEKR